MISLINASQEYEDVPNFEFAEERWDYEPQTVAEVVVHDSQAATEVVVGSNAAELSTRFVRGVRGALRTNPKRKLPFSLSGKKQKKK